MAARHLEGIAALGEAFLLDPSDRAARLKLLDAADALAMELYTPFELVARITWGETSRTAALRVAFELGLLRNLDSEPQTSQQVATGTVADPVLVARILKHLAANGIVKEVGKDVYVSTRFSRAIDDPAVSATMRYTSIVTLPTFLALPEFLSKTKYQTPTDENNSPVQFGLRSSETFFGMMRENSRLAEAFNDFMKAYARSVPSWTDVYPIRASSPLLVDVGGNLGHQLVDLHSRFPDLRGELVLQDQAPVIAAATASGELPARVTAVAHDFFTAQPAACRGARAYYMRFIMHDWPDAQCGAILSHLRDAMAPGYSRVLINDVVLRDEGASWRDTSLDWVMMAMLVSRERTESQWRELLAGVGLRMSGVWYTEGESVIEAVLAAD
ncbi:hypothetical protein ACCO45_004981 [Purpureocillium lilacinum]|uniref:Uncharacterized protein n=1 Tax=Purpureocillium lilacinum TaxID=33203 RepID=A0ACC4DWD1_PURLI